MFRVMDPASKALGYTARYRDLQVHVLHAEFIGSFVRKWPGDFCYIHTCTTSIPGISGIGRGLRAHYRI